MPIHFYSVRTPPSHPDTNGTAKIPYTHITATNPSLHFVSRAARVFMYLSTIKSSHYNHLCTIVSVKNFDRYTKCFKMRGFYFTRCAPCASFVLAPPLATSKNHIISTESVLHRHRNHHPAQKRLGDWGTRTTRTRGCAKAKAKGADCPLPPPPRPTVFSLSQSSTASTAIALRLPLLSK